MTKPFYRRKGKKIVIEQKVNGKSVYLKQLPPPEELLEILKEKGNGRNDKTERARGKDESQIDN